MIRLSLSRLARLGMIGVPCLGLACSQVPIAKSTAPNPIILVLAIGERKNMSVARLSMLGLASLGIFL